MYSSIASLGDCRVVASSPSIFLARLSSVVYAGLGVPSPVSFFFLTSPFVKHFLDLLLKNTPRARWLLLPLIQRD